jgi:outer membrane lipoprotein SlyB
MNTTISPGQAATSTNKTLWVAVSVLGVAVLAMGAALLRSQNQPAEAHTAALPAVTQPAVAASGSAATADVAKLPAPITPTKIQQNHAPAHTNQAHAAIKNKANPGLDAMPQPVFTDKPQVVHPQTPEPAVAHAPIPAKPVCANCGTVESVTPVERDGVGGGAGAMMGGVLGAVVGNQVGDGTGKALATILGAVGGGMAGNAVEKKMKKVTHYEVLVRMQDGSTRTVQQTTPSVVGGQVTVDGDTLHSANR